MARVLWLGDAGCHTGFARVTHSIGDRLVRDYGHEISVLATNHEGDWWPTELRLYRANKLSGMDRYGQGRIVEMLAEVMPEVIIILNDPLPILKFLFDNPKDPTRALLRGGAMNAPILSYVPIDGYNYPPLTSILGRVTTRIAMTKFGQAQMPGYKYMASVPDPAAGVGPEGEPLGFMQVEVEAPEARLVYHGVDTDVFRPVTKSSPMISSVGNVISSKREAKQMFGYDPDSFLVLRVDRNSERKDFADTWKALVPVMKRHSDIVVHFHCMAIGDYYNLRELITREPDVAKRVKFPDRVNSYKGWPEEDLAILYNAADLFVTTSWGEGFGLTIAEAMASGVPVIAQDVSAITEVVGPGGRLIPPGRPMVAPMGHEQRAPDVPAFTEAIERLYLAGGSRRKLGEAGRKHIVENCSWDEAAKGFDFIINEQIGQRSQRAVPAATADTGPDPQGQVQYRDEGDGGEGGSGDGASEPALHSVIDG